MQMDHKSADSSSTDYRGLPDRGILQVSGSEAEPFLQGLITNDINKVTADQAIYAGLLTPQGKFLFDFFIVRDGDTLLLDCEAAHLPAFAKRLTMYKLRSDVTLTDRRDDLRVAVALGPENIARAGLSGLPGAATATDGGICFVDPRLANMGTRLIAPASSGELPDGSDAYDRWRLQLGLPDGSRDIAVEKYFALEANFDALNGVDFDKGCYVGQELVSRMKHRKAVKKRIIPVAVDGERQAPGTPIVSGQREAGTLLSGRDATALAFLRLEMLGNELACGNARLFPQVPDWLAEFLP